MTRLSSLEIKKLDYPCVHGRTYELQISWDNDYHMAFPMPNTSPESVRDALHMAAEFINKAQRSECI